MVDVYMYLSVLPVLYTGQGNYWLFVLPDQNFHGGIIVDVYTPLWITCPVYRTRPLLIICPTWSKFPWSIHGGCIHTSMYCLSCIQVRAVIHNFSYLIKISMVDVYIPLRTSVLPVELYVRTGQLLIISPTWSKFPWWDPSGCIHISLCIDNFSYLIKISIVGSWWMYTCLSVLSVLYTSQGN